MESAATGGAAHPPGACDPPQNCGGYMSLVGHWEEAKFPAGINLVQTMAPGWRQIVSEVALDLITIPAVSALCWTGELICTMCVSCTITTSSVQLCQVGVGDISDALRGAPLWDVECDAKLRAQS